MENFGGLFDDNDDGAFYLKGVNYKNAALQMVVLLLLNGWRCHFCISSEYIFVNGWIRL